MNTIVYRTISIKVVIIALTTLFSVNCLGQGEYLNLGIHGLGLGGSYVISERSPVIGGCLGFSISGVLDFGFQAGGASFYEEDFGDDFKAKLIAPSIVVHALKQTEIIPISIAIGLHYAYYKYSGGVLQTYRCTMDASSLGCDVGLYRKFYVGGNSLIIPAVDIDYSLTKSTLKNELGTIINYRDERAKLLTFSFALSYAFSFPGYPLLYFTPQIAINNETTAFGIAIGIVIPFGMSAPSN